MVGIPSGLVYALKLEYVERVFCDCVCIFPLVSFCQYELRWSVGTIERSNVSGSFVFCGPLCLTVLQWCPIQASAEMTYAAIHWFNIDYLCLLFSLFLPVSVCRCLSLSVCLYLSLSISLKPAVSVCMSGFVSVYWSAFLAFQLLTVLLAP